MHDKQQIRNNRIDHIYRLVDSTAKSLEKIKDMLKNLDKDDQRKSYQEVEGVTGVFDGISLISKDGKKYDVPANYAAKSRLVEGDTLKMIEEDGINVFKQVEKVDRKKVEGIMTKKEGKWHIISDSGTFRVSDVAADFQHAELHDEASAFISAKASNPVFAALDNVKKKGVAPVATVTTPSAEKPFVRTPERKPAPVAATVSPTAKVSTSSTPIVRSKPRPAVRTSTASKPSAAHKAPYKPAAPVKKEFVEEIITPNNPVVTPVSLDDDDLR